MANPTRNVDLEVAELRRVLLTETKVVTLPQDASTTLTTLWGGDFPEMAACVGIWTEDDGGTHIQVGADADANSGLLPANQIFSVWGDADRLATVELFHGSGHGGAPDINLFVYEMQ